ncbi:MAG: class I SAM-dependent methyltransferase [Anaerolineales bacterium]|nr:class I SAM-dependent methyltransferase [Anaerolineales bacterium]
MLRLITKLHGIQPEETPDYGLDVPRLAKGTAVFGILSSAVVIFHVVGFISTGMFLTLRSLTDLPPGELIMLTVLSVLGLLALLISGFIFWSSRRGKFHMRDRVIAGLNLRGDEQLLDVGCGNGLLLIGAAQKLTTGTAVGVDLWRHDLESHNNRGSVLRNAKLAGVADRIRVKDADARALPFTDGRFDVVTSSLMLHHMDKAGRETAVQQMLRVLKPGGKLVIVEVAFADQLQKLLADLGSTAVNRVPLGLPVYKQIVAIK